MNSPFIPFTGACLLLCAARAAAGDVAKLPNTTSLNLRGSWDGGVVPVADDLIHWNSLLPLPSAAADLPQFGGNLAVAGVKVGDVGGTRHLANSVVGFQNTNSAHTLTLGAGGIDLSAATQALLIQSKIAVLADQTWRIGNANSGISPAGFNSGEDLTFHAQSAGAAFDFGGKTVVATGPGQATVSSGYVMSNGTLEVANPLFVIQGSTGRPTTLDSTLNLRVSSGTLRFQNNSGSLSSAAAVTVDAGTLEFFVNNAGSSIVQSGGVTLDAGSTLSFNFSQDGSSTLSGPVTVAGNSLWRVTGGALATNSSTVAGNLGGPGNITYRNTATQTNGYSRLSGDNSGYTGTFSLSGGSNNRSLRLASATAGSAAATWDIGAGNTLQIDGVAVQLGTLTGSGTVTNASGSAPATAIVGAGNFAGTLADGTSQATALTKAGPGTLALTGPNSYTGTTTVTAGLLVTTPDQSGAGDLTVSDGATFGVALETPDAPFTAGTVTLDGTLQIDFGPLANPTLPPITADELLVNGAATIRLIGTHLSTGTFPLFRGAVAGSTGFAGLTLVLPPRATGFLTDTGNGIDVTITATGQVKWNGNVSNAWNTFTKNWRGTADNLPTTYLQGPGGSDVVTFDDSASGSGSVTLAGILSPQGLTIHNSAKSYTFAGAGKLSGPAALVKLGDGSLTLANTTAYGYSGGTVIQAGTLRLGNGSTAGAGVIAGGIANQGTLVLNRPDNHDFALPVSGTGIVEKARPNVVTLTAATTLDGPLAITGGKLKFTNGATLNGVVSGSGEFEAAGGAVVLQGSAPNTHQGRVTVSAGALRLAKPAGVNAVGGDIHLTGSGTLALLEDEQIPDSTTLHVLGSATDALAGSLGTETFANAIIDGTTPDTALVLRHSANIAGTATVQQGILAVASGHEATVRAVNLTSPSAKLRITGNSAASVMHIGPGGIYASGGEIQVKSTATDQDATLHLGGTVRTTGDLAFTNAGYTGSSVNLIQLDGPVTFDTGGTTSIAPDLGGTGPLVKGGPGTLALGPSCSAALSSTYIYQGRLRVDGSLTGFLRIEPYASLSGTGTLGGIASIGGTISPGDPVGQMSSTSALNLTGGSVFAVDVASWSGLIPGTDWDHLAVDSLSFTATPAKPMTVRISGSPAGFTESNKTLAVASSAAPAGGFDPAAIVLDAAGFPGTGRWVARQAGNTIELAYTVATPYQLWATDAGLSAANEDPSHDPDHDGRTNLEEFSLDGDPLSGAASGKVSVAIVLIGGEPILTLTLPVRNGAVFSGTTGQSAGMDGIVYRIQGSGALATWDLPVSEISGPEISAIHGTLSALSPGWTYRSFRSPGPLSGVPAEFLRVAIEPGA